MTLERVGSRKGLLADGALLEQQREVILHNVSPEIAPLYGLTTVLPETRNVRIAILIPRTVLFIQVDPEWHVVHVDALPAPCKVTGDVRVRIYRRRSRVRYWLSRGYRWRHFGVRLWRQWGSGVGSRRHLGSTAPDECRRRGGV